MPAPTGQKKDVLDQEAVLSLFEGDAELLREVVELFLADCPRQLSAIREAIGRSDAAALERAAHSLKGSVSNFAAPAAFQAAFNLEEIGRARDLSKAAEGLGTLEEQISLLQTTLAEFAKEYVL